MTTVRITDLQLRTIIGTNDWEREHKQDITINVTFSYDGAAAAKSDDIKKAVDYKTITKKIIKEVEASQFLLLEKLTDHVVQIVMENPQVLEASVRIDKPHALRFARSVSIEAKDKRS